jgi:hypothetical protein
MDNSKLKGYLRDALVSILIIIVASFISYRLGVWRGENNIAEQYDIRVSKSIIINVGTGEEIRIPFRWFD